MEHDNYAHSGRLINAIADSLEQKAVRDLTPEEARVIKRRVPFHLQTGHRSRVFVSGGKVLEEATHEEIEALRQYERKIMSEVTPGQAAYERSFSAHRKLRNVEWSALDKWDRMYWDEIAAAAVAAEREACAQVCEQWDASHHERLAEAIRARGKPRTPAEQWTEQELAAIKAQGAPPLVFNKIKKP